MSIFSEEQRISKRGYRVVAGLDEAGRGPLAGPVTAAIVFIKNPAYYQDKHFKKLFRELRDSKELSERRREWWYKVIIDHLAISWAVASVSEKTVDRINILEATKLAMVKAIKKLKTEPNFLILDGLMRLNLPIAQKAIIKADEKVFACMAASVIAKVTRDRLMRRYHKKYPDYHFDQHKGYGTKDHWQALKDLGPCPIHRQSFI